nr:zinc finger, CCHC-type [Tanacetum cinerariifolium]GEZ79887.1 zinc finger, CCHC-type [Tanacetum cinerariifolium]
MTTSVVNNSVFKGLFEKQIDWYRQLRIVLSVEDKLNYLEHPILAAPVPAQVGQQVTPEALAAHAAWVKGSKEIELKTLFAQQAEQELLQTMREFHSCKQEEGQSVSSYVLKMKSYIDNLERLGHPVSLGLGVSLILISLRKEFNGFVQNFNMHSMGNTINELHAMLKLHEQTLPKTTHLHFMQFEQYLAELLKNKKLSQGASGLGVFTIKLYTFPNKSWVYDIGCGTRICNKTQDLMRSRKLKSGALSLYVGNGEIKRELGVFCYTDAGYLTDADNLKSQTGYVFILNGCAVDCKSAKQSIFATSSTETEYIAAYDASKEAA